MSGLDKVIVSSLAKVAKDSGKLNTAIDKIREKVLAKGLELVEEAGIDSSQLPVNVPQYLRGESPSAPDTLSTPENVCNMPTLTAQQAETTIRLVNDAQVEIENIYATTNQIKQTLIDIKTPISRLQTTVQPIESTVDGVSNAIKVIKLLPFPTAVPPGIGIPANILTIFSATLDSLDKLLGVAKSNLKMIPQTLEVMVRQINGTVEKLNQVEQVINPFLQTLIFVKATAELRPNCPDVTQEDIDISKQNLLDGIQGNLAIADSIENPFGISDAELESELQESSNPGLVYKNFKFVLEYDPDNTFSFPSRRIKCTRNNSTGIGDGIAGGGSVIIYNINEQTNPTLTPGEYSYSSSLRVLVNEAKFAVDQYTANITVWQAPQTRDKVQVFSDGYVDIGDLPAEEIQAYAEQLGIDYAALVNMDPLPNYIRYGTNLVNLNSSATDVETGADRLVAGTSYQGGSGLVISSYITSGTIQVNKPVSIRMKTFGGTGNPSDQYTTGFTEALLTIKRSFSIQDDVDPFTGKVKGFDGSAIAEFESDYGAYNLQVLDGIYETIREVTDEFSVNNELFGNETYIQRLKVVRNFVKDYAEAKGGGGGTILDFYGVNFNNVLAFSGLTANAINKLYNKTKPLLYSKEVLNLSKLLFGRSSGYRTGSYLQDLKRDRVYSNQNWYWTARKNAFDENVNTSGNIKDKAVTLTMTFEAFKQFRDIYNNLFGNRQEYNDGSWVGAASTIPIIPTSADGSLDDITVVLQHQQEIGRNETINESIGNLDLLGTYTYDLEIIDSLPAIGGEETNYPTNFTQFFIEEL
jgi:hypothetical protein|tara:strand:- start:354 stop:2777 length:2424 start_codon:yes stop_codon:yes gene_type:complete